MRLWIVNDLGVSPATCVVIVILSDGIRLARADFC